MRGKKEFDLGTGCQNQSSSWPSILLGPKFLGPIEQVSKSISNSRTRFQLDLVLVPKNPIEYSILLIPIFNKGENMYCIPRVLGLVGQELSILCSPPRFDPTGTKSCALCIEFAGRLWFLDFFIGGLFFSLSNSKQAHAINSSQRVSFSPCQMASIPML